MLATVSATALRLSHGPRPNRNTAANPTTTRRQVTRLGVQCMVHPGAGGGCAAGATECTGRANPVVFNLLIVGVLSCASSQVTIALRHPKMSSVGVWLPYLSLNSGARR